MREEWVDVPEFEGIYHVSSHGNVRRASSGPHTRPGKVLKPTQSIGSGGYYRISLYNNGAKRIVFIHRLVLLAFVGPRPDDKECLHIDGNKLNNRLDNLRYGTHRENMQDRIRHGRRFQPDNRGERCGAAKLKNADIHAIRYLLHHGIHPSGRRLFQREIAGMFGVERKVISDIKNGKTWRSVV